ncbi:hypothetical protein DFS33DRAFT_1490000 [Desarmillaria ectypa]|nr:hypothetical protein DFS33DRAFT_1490000 [Desarmillaria ectypa]
MSYNYAFPFPSDQKPIANANFFSPEMLMHDGRIPPPSQAQAPPPQSQAPANSGAQTSATQQGSANGFFWDFCDQWSLCI